MNKDLLKLIDRIDVIQDQIIERSKTKSFSDLIETEILIKRAISLCAEIEARFNIKMTDQIKGFTILLKLVKESLITRFKLLTICN